MLYAASTLGDFFVIDVRSGKVENQLRGHCAPINHFVEIKRDKMILTAGDDN